ncbi:coiled-coil domain-containing protein [Mycetohabitans sp. B46]|uniref:coiled-coil domain-containing protein n=1 Tax=Mycetohabitans sp. B46 TaxID=2772536 RepID=UPI00307F6596
MAAIAFDTLKFANRLKTAGVPPAQAEAEAEVFADIFEANLNQLVTKADLHAELEKLESRLDVQMDKHLADLETKMDKRFAEVDKRFADLDAKVDKGFAEVRGELDKRFAEVRGDLDKRFAEAKGEALLLKWMLGVTVASTTSLLIRSFF